MEHQRISEFSAVVDAVYEAALQPDKWPDAMESIATLHGSDKALLFTPVLSPLDGGFAFPHGISETAMIEWGSRYIALDVWTQTGIGMGLVAGRVMFDTDLISDEELLQSTFYRQFLSRHDIRRLCTGLVFDDRDPSAPATCCSIYGHARRGPFNDGDRVLHQLTLNHLSRALGTMIRLRDAELKLASTLAALDRLSGKILLIDEHGHIVFANIGAQLMLDGADGLALAAGHARGRTRGRLRAWQAEDDELLASEIRRAIRCDPLIIDHFSQSVCISRPSGKPPFLVQIASLSERTELAGAERQAWAIAFVNDPAIEVTLDSVLAKRLYGLTAAETRLANALLAGRSIDRIVKATKVSEATLRTQVQSLFAKTGTNRQSELIKLLMSVARQP